MTARRRRLGYGLRRVRLVLVAAAVVGALAVIDRWGLFGSRPLPDPEKYHGRSFRVVHVVDGDTIDLDAPDRDGRPTRVRLWGVDTPETVKPDTPPQHFGPEASEFTERVAAGRTVRTELVSSSTRDKYERLLAYVFLPDGRMLNSLLVAEGYGYADPRYDHPLAGQFRKLQSDAQAAGRGLWRDVRQEDLPYYYKSLKLPQTRPERSPDR